MAVLGSKMKPTIIMREFMRTVGKESRREGDRAKSGSRNGMLEGMVAVGLRVRAGIV